jgi:4-amino-4-deoxy-L-arabinose transferase-like glycosyltransferase
VQAEALQAERVVGLVRESYEGVQGPAYYALMAVPYRLAHPLGVLAALYAVRLASLLLALTAVPIAYLLARELFPARKEAWLAAPALLVVLQGFNGNVSSVSNDALVVPLAGAVLLAVATARRTGLSARNAAVTGVLLGVGLCTKSQMAALSDP